MSISSTGASERPGLSAFFHMGLFWFLIATLGALIFFRAGIEELLIAWQLPEYSLSLIHI